MPVWRHLHVLHSDAGFCWCVALTWLSAHSVKSSLLLCGTSESRYYFAAVTHAVRSLFVEYTFLHHLKCMLFNAGRYTAHMGSTGI